MRSRTSGTQVLEPRQMLVDAKGRMETLTQDLAKAEQRNGERRIVAPIDGAVQQPNLHTIGGVVSPAQELMVIVPDDSGPEIEAMIPSKDIGFVADGQETTIKLEAFPFTRYGTVDGKVVTVSRDAVLDEMEGTLMYAGRVGMEEVVLNFDSQDVAMAPGMTVLAGIKTGDQRFIEFLLSSFIAMGDEAMRER